MEDDRFFIHRRVSNWKRHRRRPLWASPEGIHVWVSCLEEDTAGLGLDRDWIKAEVEGRLAAAGIPVLPQPAGATVPAAPCLGVLLNLRKAGVLPSFYLFSIEVFFIQASFTEYCLSGSALQMTWCREAIGEAPETPQGPDWSGFFTQMGVLVEAFIRDYLTANPPAKAAYTIN